MSVKKDHFYLLLNTFHLNKEHIPVFTWYNGSSRHDLLVQEAGWKVITKGKQSRQKHLHIITYSLITWSLTILQMISHKKAFLKRLLKENSGLFFFPEMDFWPLSVSLIVFLIEKQENETNVLLEIDRRKLERAWWGKSKQYLFIIFVIEKYF